LVALVDNGGKLLLNDQRNPKQETPLSKYLSGTAINVF
jgi:hypothetical protein